MPKGKRKNYKRQDFSYLLTELQEEKKKAEAPAETRQAEGITPQKKEPIPDSVAQARRLRQSKLDDRKMRYAFSTRRLLLHDRDCPLVRNIPDEEFEMRARYDVSMRFCTSCYRMGLIRNGIGDDGKRMSAYMGFFGKAGASNRDLYSLLIDHDARLRWENRDTMMIRCREDTWKIVRKGEGWELLHNNYIRLSDDKRYFNGGFHHQKINGEPTFHNFVRTICGYSWQAHLTGVEMRNLQYQKEQEALRREKENIAEAEERLAAARAALEAGKTRYFAKRGNFFFIYREYAFVDTAQYSRDEWRKKYGIRLRFLSEFVKEGHEERGVVCRIRRRDEARFLDALQTQRMEAFLDGYRDSGVWKGWLLTQERKRKR